MMSTRSILSLPDLAIVRYFRMENYAELLNCMSTCLPTAATREGD